MSGSTQLEILLPECRAYALAICSGRDEAEDLVQDAMLRALRAPGLPDRREDLRPWLFRVIRNLYYDRLRRARVRRNYVVRANYDFNTDFAYSDQERDVFVRRAFSELKPELREVLFLVGVLGMKYNEAAQALNIPPGTVMSRISRARRTMLEKLNGESRKVREKDAL